ncbi:MULTISPECIES: electron transport complex subunit RsxG [Methylococcus]|jgi:electron transport complex protein RnfG|uniref:Ion-translocating oxidoreductase complex subunit G n=1 Tax=Methylococcus capsulatus TaxID=414 RepID=A0AA35UUQ7_METCP|nr:electron transport complex subunit RsxG [Methylococcus capsulatus]QXP92039.1 electron transport complex subunit RsxG [Methylococcus capsulatus]QXP93688.1 electron transport complex subunit RsxG [Methylococcus capsulatus]CAI8805482.1 SoxR [2Fe-2S] reducing system protein RsxG [Methylococcus capsulatus]
MSLTSNPVIAAAFLLGVFSIAGTGLVSTVFHHTEPLIEANERATLLHSIEVLVPPDSFDNDPLTDTIELTAPLLGTRQPVPVYRARKAGKPVTAVLSPIAPDGYNGAIRLLVAVHYDGSLAGVRVLSHKETPGLGDPIEEHKSDWIQRFAGLSLQNPPEPRWGVKKDGGDFDQFTGATITPRAVVQAVRKTLQFFRDNRDLVFAPLPPKEIP